MNPFPSFACGDSAAEKALAWLNRRHGDAVRAAVDAMLFDGLGEFENRALVAVDPATARRIERNAAEWLLAEGRILVDGRECAAAACVLAPDGPPLDDAERNRIEELTRRPLRLYEVIAVSPGGKMSLRDALEAAAPVVEVDAPDEALPPARRVGLRLLEAGGRSVASDALYAFSAPAGEGILAQLREAAAQFGDLPEMQGVLIRYCWLAQHHEAAGAAIDPYAAGGCATGTCGGCAGARAAERDGQGCGDDIERALAAAFGPKD
jgi:hypothetical protein